MTKELYSALMQTDDEVMTDGNMLNSEDSNGVVMLPPLLDTVGLDLVKKKGMEVSQLSGPDGVSLLKHVNRSMSEIRRINAKHLILTIPITANVKQQDVMCRNAVTLIDDHLKSSGKSFYLWTPFSLRRIHKSKVTWFRNQYQTFQRDPEIEVNDSRPWKWHLLTKDSSLGNRVE